MGKGDKKTKKGKIYAGTYGVSRPKKKQSGTAAAVTPKVKTEEKAAKPAAKKSAKK